MQFVFVAGTTETARIDGISAAGADPAAMAHTPSADLEIVAYGQPVASPVVPVSPSGCPTPAVVTRAVRELVGFETLPIDAGLARPTAAPTYSLDVAVGRDVREERAVPDAESVFETASSLGRDLPDDELVVGETIPGGTTTALGVLTALGERQAVSSSLPENPLARKRQVVETALAASGLQPGSLAGDPVAAIRHVGDPVLGAVAGLVTGAVHSGTRVTLAGGTQLAAAGALVRHAGVDDPLTLATTPFVASDDTAQLRELAADVDLDLTVTDPGFDQSTHPAMGAYVSGEAKEGVGMGGALALADRPTVSMAAVRDCVATLTDDLLEHQSRAVNATDRGADS